MPTLPNRPLFVQSLNIVNSLFLTIVLTFFIEPEILSSFISSFFPASILDSALWLILILLLPVQIYFYSGLYGSLVDFVIQKGESLSFCNFPLRANKLWKLYLPFFFLPNIGHFIYFTQNPEHQLPLTFFKAISSILILPIFSFLIIKQNYPDFSKSIKTFKISIGHVLTVLCIFGFNIAIYYICLGLFPKWNELYRHMLFISHYLDILTFTYITGLIINSAQEINTKNINQKELILINPPLSGSIISGLVSIINRYYPPIFVILKALTPKEYKITEYNRVIWHNHYYKSNALVAITCSTSNSAEAYKIAKEFRKLGSKVIMGGPHVSNLPQEALHFCDSVVLGEAEGAWTQIISDYENNCLQKTYKGEHIESFHDIVYEKLLQSSPQIIRDFLITSTGCKFRCSFCTIPSHDDGRVRINSAEKVAQLLRKVKTQYSSVVFLDNNIYNDPAYAKTLFETIKPINIKWESFSTIDIAQNDKVLQLAKESGCTFFHFGYEIAGDSPEIKQHGKLAMAQRYLDYSRKVKKFGINIRGNLIFGFDSDSYKTLFNTWKFILFVRPHLTNVGLLTPMPGTQLYAEMVKDNRLLNLNWKHYAGLDMVFRHKNLNAKWTTRVLVPFVKVFFFLTTSQIGNVVLISLIAAIWLVNVFFI